MEPIKLTHSFDLTVIGPPGFSSRPTSYSNLTAAHGKARLLLTALLSRFKSNMCLTEFCTVFEGSLKSADGSISIPVVAGSDWMRLQDGYGDINARVSCASPAGSAHQLQCDISYTGKIAFSETMTKLGKGEAHSFNWGDVYYHTTPLLESRCKELAWVNKTVFVSIGKLSLTENGNIQADYRIFKID